MSSTSSTIEINKQVVAPQPGVMLFGGTFTPDATSIDFVRQAAGGPFEIWRVPFLGGPSRLFIANVATPISWSPDHRRLAFIRTQVTPSLSSKLIVADSDGGQEHVLATSHASVQWVQLFAPWRPAFRPPGRPMARRSRYRL